MKGTNNSAKVSSNELNCALLLSTSQSHTVSIGVAKPVTGGLVLLGQLTHFLESSHQEQPSYTKFKCPSGQMCSLFYGK